MKNVKFTGDILKPDIPTCNLQVVSRKKAVLNVSIQSLEALTNARIPVACATKCKSGGGANKTHTTLNPMPHRLRKCNKCNCKQVHVGIKKRRSTIHGNDDAHREEYRNAAQCQIMQFDSCCAAFRSARRTLVQRKRKKVDTKMINFKCIVS